MLRTSIRSRALNGALTARSQRQWLSVQHRYYADPSKLDSSAGVPTSTINLNTTVGSTGVTPPPDVNPANIPRLPPTPAEVGAAINKAPAAPTVLPPTGTGTASTSPPIQPPKKKGRFRRFVLYLLILSALGYGGGVYAALRNDNWHDFFTEYVPFGEDAVAYFEERAFKKRFPAGPSRLHQQVRGENKVKIGSNSGVSAHIAQDDKGKPSSDLGASGRHMSALEDTKAPTPNPAVATAVKEGDRKSVENKPTPKASSAAAPAKAAEKAKNEPVAVNKVEPIKTEAPPPAAPIKAIDNLNIGEANEPVVQDVVKILNDIITVINADNAQSKYGSTISTAKDNLNKVITDISTLKATEQKAAEDKIKALHSEFDGMAKELMRRQEEAIQNQEMRWKEEYEQEQSRVKDAYDSKLRAEFEEAQKVYDQKLRNELLEQSIALRKEFSQQVRDQVEGERSGRLSKLSELQTSVSELEKLTGEWNEVVDTNLKTQHLLVAVEAVKMKLETADRQVPFIQELAALKEVASDDAIVNAAIASITPSAYQRGIPTPAQLIDRFRRVAHEVRKASLLPENAGVASHVASLVLSKVMFKKGGLPVGEDVESVLARAEGLLEEGDLETAAREVNGLSGWAKTLSRDWLGDVRRVLEVQQALDVIATEARLQTLLVD